MKTTSAAARKPKALVKGARFSIFAPASPAGVAEAAGGIAELQRLGFVAMPHRAESQTAPTEGYFSSSTAHRLQEFRDAVRDPGNQALIALRGGYGSTYLLGAITEAIFGKDTPPKCLIGFSDLTSLQIYLWQTLRWVTFYGPMVATGFAQGANSRRGYELNSLLQAIGNTTGGWSIALQAESLFEGHAEGVTLGGCLTLLETTIGTPWELDTRDSILVLEDTGMKPYQVDRALMHLLQAGKFEGVRGIVLGDFPGGPPIVAGSPTTRDVCKRVLAPLNIPVVYGAPIGHTDRPMLTVPLGIQAKLHATGGGTVEFLEAAVS